jgi:hypothetical protein
LEAAYGTLALFGSAGIHSLPDYRLCRAGSSQSNHQEHREQALGLKAVIWLRRCLFAALSILVLYLLFVLHAWPFRIDTSHTQVNVVAGFFCGPLLAIWVNSIINSPAQKGLSKGQIVGLSGLAALAVAGSVGDEGAKLLQRYFRNVSSVRIGGAALQFGGNDRRDATPGAPSTPPAGSKGTAVASSQGLQYASKVGS